MNISTLITQQKKLSHTQLNKLVSLASTAPFSLDPLEVDEPLWGSFWQFDVLAPGSTLPTAELALLRVIRLDESWPDNTSPTQFLANMHTVIAHPQSGIWTTVLAKQPMAIFVAPSNIQPFNATAVWYCCSTERLHAGYRVVFDPLHFTGMVVQRAPGFAGQQNKATPPRVDWPTVTIEQHLTNKTNTLATQLDTAILRHRLGAND